MQIIRTILWVLAAVLWLGFFLMNLEPVPVNFWPSSLGYFNVAWPVGVIASVFFLLGLLPMYLVHRTTRWRLQRRINALDNTLAATSTPAPLATATQLEAEAARAEGRSLTP